MELKEFNLEFNQLLISIIKLVYMGMTLKLDALTGNQLDALMGNQLLEIRVDAQQNIAVIIVFTIPNTRDVWYALIT